VTSCTDADMNGDVIINDEDCIRVIRMHRAEKKNAITFAMYEAMAGALENANESDAVRCILIAGVPGAFSAGNDLADFLRVIENTSDATKRPASRFLRALVGCRRPIVAAVNGLAVGIGTTLLLHCDFVVAATDARFSTPFVSLGLVPEAGSSLLAPLLFGDRRAFELLVMGHALTAEDAKAFGLINTIACPEAVEARAMDAAREIADLPPQAVRATRELIRGSLNEVLERMERENAVFAERLRSPESKAAIEAFFRRKMPKS
jgi:enoyl-CoA hydratase/carnithine racemase